MNNEAPRKFDQTKPQLDLIPSEALEELGKVLAYGATKYSRGNWSKGLAYSRIYSAALRHMLAWNGGENNDPETGLSHLAHAMCNMCFLIWYMKHRPDLDDRWSPEAIKSTLEKDFPKEVVNVAYREAQKYDAGSES